MRPPAILLFCLLTGCHVISPLPGQLTQSVSEDQITGILEKHLKPGISVDEAHAFLRSEDFERRDENDSKSPICEIWYSRRDQVDFWIHQDWRLCLVCHGGKLQSFSLKSCLTGP